MAKPAITRINQSNMKNGILNLDDLTIDMGEELGVKDLSELLKDFDGKLVTITVKVSDDIIE